MSLIKLDKLDKENKLDSKLNKQEEIINKKNKEIEDCNNTILQDKILIESLNKNNNYIKCL